MTTIYKRAKRKTSDKTTRVFHIRRARQWFGKNGLTQKELAKLSGVPARMIHDYERRKQLPASLTNLIRLAVALRRSVESLIDSRILLPIIQSVEQNREAEEQTDRCRLDD